VTTTSWTQTDIERLERTIATRGHVKSMSFSDGRSVIFADLKAMLELLATMRQSVEATSSGRSSSRLASVSKGV
jgi:hypothetical protein